MDIHSDGLCVNTDMFATEFFVQKEFNSHTAQAQRL